MTPIRHDLVDCAIYKGQANDAKDDREHGIGVAKNRHRKTEQRKRRLACTDSVDNSRVHQRSGNTKRKRTVDSELISCRHCQQKRQEVERDIRNHIEYRKIAGTRVDSKSRDSSQDALYDTSRHQRGNDSGENAGDDIEYASRTFLELRLLGIGGDLTTHPVA